MLGYRSLLLLSMLINTLAMGTACFQMFHFVPSLTLFIVSLLFCGMVGTFAALAMRSLTERIALLEKALEVPRPSAARI
jgi:hypothetical protein